MSMIWNTDPVGHCLVFPSLQITKSTVAFYLVASELVRISCHRTQLAEPPLLAVVLLGVAAEWLRLSLTTFDRNLRSNLRGGGSNSFGAGGGSSTPVLGGNGLSRANTPAALRRPSGFGATDNSGEEALLGGGGSKSGRYWGIM